MKGYKNRSLSDTISTIGSMLLFLIFAACLLMIIAVAAGTYSRISTNFGKTFGASASLRYVTNKIRSADESQIVENGILLKSDGILDIIYFENGVLYEKSVSADTEPELSGGDKLFELKSMEITDLGNMYKISVVFYDEENLTLVRKG